MDGSKQGNQAKGMGFLFWGSRRPEEASSRRVGGPTEKKKDLGEGVLDADRGFQPVASKRGGDPLPISHKKINSTNNVNKLGLQQIQAQTWETLHKVPSYAMPGPPPLGNGIQM